MKSNNIFFVISISVLVFFTTCSNTIENQSLNGHWEGEMLCGNKSLMISFEVSGDKFLYDIPGVGSLWSVC